MKKRLLVLALVAVMACALFPMSALAADGDFVIERGVLTKYTGPGGNVVIPDGVTRIGISAFWSCADMTSVTIPDSVTSIEDRAFWSCTGLTGVTIPDSVTSIGNIAFENCTSLTSVTIPDSVFNIGAGAFDGTPWLKDQGDFAIANGILVSYEGSGGDVTIPNGVTSIGKGAFLDCTSLTSVTIPDSVTSIGNGAFRGCTSLTSVTIPDGVTSIGTSAFYQCYRLSSVTIPDSVTSIGASAFCECVSLTSVTIPDGVTCIEGDVFEGCIRLTDVTIPESVNEIEWYAFSECTSLTSVTIPDSVTWIGASAFGRCTSLTNVTIGSGVTSIQFEAFARCDNLTNVYYNGTEAQWETIYIGGANIPLKYAKIHYEPAAQIPEDSSAPVNTACPSAQMVDVDGTPVEFQCYALKDENGFDTNYIKLRDVADVLNGSAAQFQVGWDGSIAITTGQSYTKNGTEMARNFTGDQPYKASVSPVTVNGVAADLEAITLTDANGGGYTYFKLRDLGAALGFQVDWSASRGIYIETK